MLSWGCVGHCGLVGFGFCDVLILFWVGTCCFDICWWNVAIMCVQWMIVVVLLLLYGIGATLHYLG